MQWIATCLLVSALAVAAEDESSLTVHLLDYADAPTATLIEAEHQVSEIFQDAGIRIVWLNANMNSGQLVPAWNSAAGAELLVNVISRKMNSALGFSQTTLGLTSYEGELPTCAYICFPCITDSANRHADEGERNWWRSVILRSAMAHELGHLLGIRQHSATGLMHAPCSVGDLTKALTGQFRFFAQEKRTIRAHLQKRILFAAHRNLDADAALANQKASQPKQR